MSTTTPVLATTTVAIDQTTLAPVDETLKTPIKEKTAETEVRNYFADIPVLINIAGCESGFQQTDADGNLIHGKVNHADVGVMQINEYYHGESAERLGYNIETLDGNMSFARHLYKVYGTEPWSASKKCWGTMSTVVATK